MHFDSLPTLPVARVPLRESVARQFFISLGREDQQTVSEAQTVAQSLGESPWLDLSLEVSKHWDCFELRALICLPTHHNSRKRAIKSQLCAGLFLEIPSLLPRRGGGVFLLFSPDSQLKKKKKGLQIVHLIGEQIYTFDTG